MANYFLFRKSTVRSMVRGAVVAALYTAISIVLAPISYGAVQLRVAEALTLLPVFGPEAVVGVTLGCLLTNILGSSPIDAVFGTLATLVAALLTYLLRNLRWRGLPVLSALAPVIINALVVGAEITFFFMGTPATLPVLLLNMATVGLGELVSCVLLGLLLVRAIERSPRVLELLQSPPPKQ